MKKATHKLLDPILREHKMSGTWKADDVRNILQELETYDIAVARKKKISLAVCIISFVVAIVPLFVGFFYLLPLALVGIVFIFLFRRYRSFDIDDQVRLFVKPMVESLQYDVKKDAYISVDLELLPLDNNKYLTNKGEPYAAGAYPKCCDYTYKRDFLKLKIPLVDGNKLAIGVDELLTKTEKTKTNPRGKTKTKYKYAKKTGYSLELKVNTERFSVSRPAAVNKIAEGAPEINVAKKDGATVVTGSFTVKSKEKSAGKAEICSDPVILLGGLTQLYAALKPATTK
ncbi:MAG TPA: hypothetical protein PLM53_10790 [Spirochaetota bacterium]|nr:hypothetical protein [Spirochaetota bacterium]HQH97576.1 hypothetical protein [Spirochaetota bacterium]